MSEKKYNVSRHTFFKWYFSEPNKHAISAFIAPKLLNLVNEDVSFSLQDILISLDTLPSSLVTAYKGAPAQIKTQQVVLT